MVKLNNLNDKIKKGSYVRVALESKDPAYFDKTGKAITFIENICVDFDCDVEDFSEMFIEFLFESGEVQLDILEPFDFQKLSLNPDKDFMMLSDCPNFDYVLHSLCRKKTVDFQ